MTSQYSQNHIYSVFALGKLTYIPHWFSYQWCWADHFSFPLPRSTTWTTCQIFENWRGFAHPNRHGLSGNLQSKSYVCHAFKGHLSNWFLMNEWSTLQCLSWGDFNPLFDCTCFNRSKMHKCISAKYIKHIKILSEYMNSVIFVKRILHQYASTMQRETLGSTVNRG